MREGTGGGGVDAWMPLRREGMCRPFESSRVALLRLAPPSADARPSPSPPAVRPLFPALQLHTGLVDLGYYPGDEDIDEFMFGEGTLSALTTMQVRRHLLAPWPRWQGACAVLRSSHLAQRAVQRGQCRCSAAHIRAARVRMLPCRIFHPPCPRPLS